MKSGFRAALVMTTALAGVGMAGGSAFAGGFINSSQSTVFNGMAYAGAAAPGSSSAATMFYNPATITGFSRFTLDSNYTFGIPETKITSSTNVGAYNAAFSGRSGDVGLDYFVPATYVVYPVNDRIFLGLSVNTTYGNSTKAENVWQGSLFASTSKLRIITATPTIAYKINEAWSVGIGVQIQYASAHQTARLPGAPFTAVAGGAGITESDGWGFGVTAGVTWQPFKGTQIGLGWRSLVDQKISGRTVFGPAVSENSEGTLNLPNRVNLSLRQAVSQRIDLLASVEWQNWGRIGHARLDNPANAALAVLPFGYSDGWFFSVGGEYKATDQLTLRAGIGYEVSPVRDSVRRVTLPDNDRLWLSAGLSYDWSDRFTFNASYSFLHVKDAPITQTSGALTLTGESKATAHLISVGLTSRWGGAPKKEEPLVKKF
ncbi:OmpP1/FadL family transporter [Rhabdaerophilum calidifontis]|uniref:OmpP1/FadL family transporter n=1 Tax=Rhabdaerophilum calidifontis TaxID=2604328 RepID=UPI001238A3C7|nr:OmpP1/FadL family transporter [Rhabdaerophilum calidifontis]